MIWLECGCNGGQSSFRFGKAEKQVKSFRHFVSAVLTAFVQEEFLRKLSKSGYDNFLILKGGLFIYTLTNFESRATIDVDFLLTGYKNSFDTVKDMPSKYLITHMYSLNFLKEQITA